MKLPKETFMFSCTGCGKCCHELVEGIVLNPFDVYTMSRASGLAFLSKHKRGYLTTSELHSHFGEAFDFSALPFALSAAVSKKKNKNFSFAGARLSPRTGPDPEDSVCHFAYPLIQKKSSKTTERSEPSTSTSTSTTTSQSSQSKTKTFLKDMGEFYSLEEFTKYDGDKNLQRMRGKILCGLGSAMPSACLLYPLGHNGVKVTSFDTEDCEGVNAPGASINDIKQYVAERGILEKREHWNWFEEVAKKFGEFSFTDNILALESELKDKGDSQLADHAQSFYASLATLWFNFEALKCAPVDGYASWTEAQRVIEKNSDTMKTIGEEVIKFESTETFRESFPLFKEQMQKNGLVLRE
jgi:Fe-S-cluster containining protein